MKNLITPKQSHLLWQDETRDPFLLTEFCEIYRYSDTELALIFFTRTIPTILKGLFYEIEGTGDKLYTCRTNVANLPEILRYTKLKRRININGKRLKYLEKKLGHKILPYRPQNLRVKGDGHYKKLKNLMKKSRNL